MYTRDDPKREQEGIDIQAMCRDCLRETAHRVISSAELKGEYSEGQFSVTSWDEYQVIECKGCRTITFRHCNRHTEHTDHDPLTGEEFLIPQETFYPEPFTGRSPVHDSDLLPSELRAVYEETLIALDNDLCVLASIGIRAMVETMCKDKDAKGKDLAERIDALVLKGVVGAEGAEILHSLRIMGNKAAHEVKPHPKAELQIAMNAIEHALQGAYILPIQAADLPRRTPPTLPDQGHPPAQP